MMADSAGLAVTGHGGKFGVSAPVFLTIAGTRAQLVGRDGVTESVDLSRAYAAVLGSCITVEDPETLVAFSTRDVAIFSEIREASPLELTDQLDEAAAALGRRNRFSWKVIAIVLLAIGLSGVILYQGAIALAQLAVHRIPVSVDQVIGEAAHDSLLASETIVQDAEINQVMGQILDSLRPHISLEGIKPKLVVVEGEQVNAYCLPGGYITVYTGLLRSAGGPDEVAGVLAHELAHATQRHGILQLAQSLTLSSVVEVLLGDLTGVLALGKEGAGYLIRQGYSRDHENEADIEGLRMLMAAGWNPQSLAVFFEKLEKKQDVLSPPEWFSTHPNSGSRARSIRERAATMTSSNHQSATIDWPALQSALGE
ncbi:MAG: M48 family metallopeptidase [Planctomycetota bacterium]